MERLEDLCSGPGKLTQALGIELVDNGCDLSVGPVVIARRPRAWRDAQVAASKRIGITKATELEWRFSPWAAGACHGRRCRGRRVVAGPPSAASVGPHSPASGQ